MPAARSQAQIEAFRRNGARSRGPVTEEGKAKASRNALKHGLTAMHHLVLEDEAPSELEEMTARLMAEVEPMSEMEARIARRLAIAFWKGERAERIEARGVTKPVGSHEARGGTILDEARVLPRQPQEYQHRPIEPAGVRFAQFADVRAEPGLWHRRDLVRHQPGGGCAARWRRSARPRGGTAAPRWGRS